MTIDTDSLNALGHRYDLLQHTFYQRWVAGELTHEELDDYAGQYAHVVAGLPRWLEAAADVDPDHAAALRAHAREEAGHVAIWDEFARALGPDREVDAPHRATAELLARCDRLAAEGHGAAVSWALEAQSPEVSATKLSGLAEHYAIDAANGGRYFALHAERDIEHREELAGVIDRDAGASEAAEQVLAGLWDLLTSVDRTVPAS
ncbi:MAG TPA: iron-containing redox enzyme family protein [Candidatus Dormibacteraeota bacterium]|jgi:pyrroloquinoline-quinone synthase|nr:iron-containing redox enzyme family protein [Candidatus Dormibacteraeota bacterium]